MKYNIINSDLIWTDIGFGNSAAIDLGEQVYIVDSMLNWRLAVEWRDIVEEHFNKPIAGLILTHHHADHVFGNQVFGDVPIIASSDIKTMMMGFETEYWINTDAEEQTEWENQGYGIKEFQYTYPTICFAQRLELHGPKTMKLIQANGHTSGSTYLWQPDTKTLITGDLVFNREGPYGADESCNILVWQKAIESLIALKPDIIVSGHGPEATIQDLNELNDFFINSIALIKKKLDEGLTPEEIVVLSEFPDYYYSDRMDRKKGVLNQWIHFLQKNP
ncbi:MAG: MBL fold metallo-hydrolase [Candidatus Hodarchaeales archaeon]|jgi:glyoxylase-like metal-dependent hydrolase (beta-lactamase superfamily II)